MWGKIFLGIGVISFLIVVVTSFPVIITKTSQPGPWEFILPSSSWLKFSAVSSLLAIAFMLKQMVEKE